MSVYLGLSGAALQDVMIALACEPLFNSSQQMGDRLPGIEDQSALIFVWGFQDRKLRLE
jgi:hypothetical protein